MNRTVGYASEPDPRLAEVICLPCARALPDARDAYGYAVPAQLAHLTVCAICGAEPGNQAPEVTR